MNGYGIRHLERKSPFKYNIDALVTRGNSIFGYGWIFHEASEIKKASLKLSVRPQGKCIIPIVHGRPRDDVAKAYPNNHQALYSGFIVYGGWQGQALEGAQLICSTESGEEFSTPIPIQQLDKKWTEESDPSTKLLIYKLLLKRFFSLLSNGNFKGLIEKSRRYFSRMPSNSNDPVKEITSLWIREGRPEVTLIIDHDLGGGANSFRKKVVEDELKKGHIVILFTYHVLLLQYVLEIYTKNSSKRFSIDIDSLLALPQSIKISRIFYNTGVSFERPEDLPILLTTMSERHKIPLTLAINDYFVICPSQFLLDHRGKYCDIPSINVCKECLSKNEFGFISLFLDRDIKIWRNRWEQALQTASEIICFSKSSKKLLEKAYPLLDFQEKIVIRPHRVSPPSKVPKINLESDLHIGVVGHINIHKGGYVIKELADHIKRKGLPIRITVFGTIEGACDPKVVRLLGEYKFDELPTLIESSGANIFFMPSICPETFSYVTHELIQMRLPLVCFNLGAQAERVATYEKGLILPIDITSEEIIKRLQAFHQRLRTAGNDVEKHYEQSTPLYQCGM